ncbi:putative RNA-directed DNA polymerase [Tanacetum coccineum]
MKQKCRLRWAVEGDENSRFFHSILKNRYAKFSIKGIHVNGSWVESPGEIKQAALDYYAARFKESNTQRPLLDSPLFKKLSESDADFLESKFTVEEVTSAVWDCAGSKAPGPDEFNFNFIKTFWDVVKTDFWNCIRQFETTDVIKKGLISKLLASHLAKVIGNVISPNQSAFIKGRQILDGCLVANEIICMANLDKQQLLLFKVDFEKAFDSVNWNFLLDIMRQMGFGHKWRNWIASFLSSTSISVLINGSPSNEFFMERGLRQGDPLSPFLFLLVAKALQVTILNACDRGLFTGVCLANSGKNISLLQFADDALFFGEWSSTNAYNLINILRCFEMGSGLKINLDKSCLFGVGIPVSEVISVASSLGCAHGIIPFIYLGLPVGRRMRLINGWQGIINRLRNRLPLWKAKSLSVGGRLTLIKSVLEEQALWQTVIKEFYGDDGGFDSHSKSQGGSGVWSDIIKAIKKTKVVDSNFKNSFVCKVADGENTSFWHDAWCGDGTRFRDKFPSKHSLGSHHKWNSWIPRKVNIMVWKASLNRLATRPNLAARGVTIASTNCPCPFCDSDTEDIEHVLIKCPRVKMGNGTNTSLWFDNWCEYCPVIWFLTPRDISREGYHIHSSLAELVLNGSWSWPQSWLLKASDLGLILVRALDISRDDIRQWRDSNGSFSEFFCCEGMGRFQAESLKTQDSMRHWDVCINIDLNLLRCALCETQPDSHAHLFFKFLFSSKVVISVVKVLKGDLTSLKVDVVFE